MKIKKQLEEYDRVACQVNSVGPWIINCPRNENVNELHGKPVYKFFSYSESGWWIWIFGYVSQGKMPKTWIPVMI